MKRLNLKKEASRCLLCNDAPCSAACKNGDPARAVRAVRFDNENNAAKWVQSCTGEDLIAAEEACIHYDRPVRISQLVHSLPEPSSAAKERPSLEITFCGIPCESPFFLASSAVCTNYAMVAAAFEAGWAGVYYKTICLQKIEEVSPRFDAVKRPDGSFAGFRNMEQLPEDRFMRIHRSYIISLRHIAKASRTQVLLDNGVSLPVGELYRPAFAQHIA